MREKLIFCAISVCISLFSVSSAFEWTNSSLTDASVTYACLGSKTSLRWDFTLNPGEAVVETRWMFQSGATERMIALTTHGAFVPLQGDRLSYQPSAGISISNVTTADKGNYSVEVTGHDSSGLMFVQRRNVTLDIVDTALSQDGRLVISQLPHAAFDNVTHQWHAVLTCGAFNHPALPPFDVVWIDPQGHHLPSSGYNNGHFLLTLDNPVTGGSYSCRLQPGPDVTGCFHDYLSHVPPAVMTLDTTAARLAVVEAESRVLRQDFETLKQDCGTRSELLQMQQSLTDQIQAVRNGTRIELLQMQQSLVDQIQAVSDDVCRINYTTINDTNGVRDLNNSVGGYLCDNTMTAGWYRWLLRGQDAIIPTSCTPMYKCGTDYTMWIDLNGQPLPSVGRDVQGRVCAVSASNCCRWQTPSVTVRNCGSYYIYYLTTPDPGCYLAYCLQGKI